LEQNHLVENLSSQVQSFQEGFKKLTKADSLEDIMKNFWRLLKANFFISDIYLYHRNAPNSPWENLIPQQIVSQSDILLPKERASSVVDYDNHNYSAIITFSLTDASEIGIILGVKPDNTRLTDFEKITLQMLVQIFSGAYESFLNQKKEKTLIFGLNEKIMQLNNLIDAGIELSRFDNYNSLFEIALEKITSLTNASSGLITLSNDETGSVESTIVFPAGIPPENIINSGFRIESYFNFNKKNYRFILSEKETRKGVTNFNELDQLLLNAVSKQTQTAIENDYLLKQSLEKERIEKEMALAAAIQQRIIPEQLPKIEGYELSGINIPSREVGGDYYDCIDLGNGIYAFIIADVTGKGISAALLVNTLNAALYSYLEFNLPLNDMVDKLNKLIFNATPSDKFITFFIAVLDAKTGNLDAVNAGHNPVLLIRNDGTLEKIEAGGLGLGMLDLGLPFKGQRLTLNAGDRLFLYTDGIPEAMNINEEEYSDERMIDFFRNNSNQPSLEFITGMVNDIKSHVNGEPQSDDITCLILKKIN